MRTNLSQFFWSRAKASESNAPLIRQQIWYNIRCAAEKRPRPRLTILRLCFINWTESGTVRCAGRPCRRQAFRAYRSTNGSSTCSFSRSPRRRSSYLRSASAIHLLSFIRLVLTNPSPVSLLDPSSRSKRSSVSENGCFEHVVQAFKYDFHQIIKPSARTYRVATV